MDTYFNKDEIIKTIKDTQHPKAQKYNGYDLIPIFGGRKFLWTIYKDGKIVGNRGEYEKHEAKRIVRNLSGCSSIG